MKLSYFTSESVSEGHPDKVADQISDSILDYIIKRDKHAKVACEVYIKSGIVIVGGEINTNLNIDLENIVRNTIRKIGYIDSSLGFDANTCGIINIISKQSSDISLGLGNNKDIRAGDQGIMFGYASKETDVYMPAPIIYAHNLVKKQSELRKKKILPWLYPDAKSQLTFIYNDDNNIIGIDSVVFSTQHSSCVSDKILKESIMEEIIYNVLPTKWLNKYTKYFINPIGRFVIGGPFADCGLTGRKIIVDTYGGMARHGGGCFSGKDPSKVDRSGSYLARYIAKNIVAANLSDKCEIQLSYVIGCSKPISIMINTFGTEKISLDFLNKLIIKVFDFKLNNIIHSLDLLKPIYFNTSVYGHFGRNEFSWESLNKVNDLLKFI